MSREFFQHPLLLQNVLDDALLAHMLLLQHLVRKGMHRRGVLGVVTCGYVVIIFVLQDLDRKQLARVLLTGLVDL